MRDRAGKTWTEPMHSHEIVGLDGGRIEYLTVPKGAGVFFTSMTIHGSFANRSGDRPRLAFATHYVKDGTWVYRADIQDTTPVDAA
jgi:ectoine hydroxylase-related dioxygenase (phytanoyl-CoA dioxygenase family)